MVVQSPTPSYSSAARYSNTCFALVICYKLSSLSNHAMQRVEKWFMYHYARLTKTADQNKDYCCKLQFKTGIVIVHVQD